MPKLMLLLQFAQPNLWLRELFVLNQGNPVPIPNSNDVSCPSASLL